MLIKDKEKFLQGMLNLFESCEHIGCTAGIKYDGDQSVSAEDFVKAYKMYELSKADNPTDRQIEYTEQWIREWITRGPIFVIFNDPQLMEDVNEYITAQNQPCSCGQNEKCSQCPSEVNDVSAE